MENVVLTHPPWELWHPPDVGKQLPKTKILFTIRMKSMLFMLRAEPAISTVDEEPCNGCSTGGTHVCSIKAMVICCRYVMSVSLPAGHQHMFMEHV